MNLNSQSIMFVTTDLLGTVSLDGLMSSYGQHSKSGRMLIIQHLSRSTGLNGIHQILLQSRLVVVAAAMHGLPTCISAFKYPSASATAVIIFVFPCHHHCRRGAALLSTSNDGDKHNSYNRLFMTIGRN